MKITSWNVNSIKARREHVEKYLSASAADILMVQELKGETFPTDDFKALGWETAAVTQKAYNGVAVFSKDPITVILDHLPLLNESDEADEQARYIEFETHGLRLINIYLPNGNPVSPDTSSLQKQGSNASTEQDSGFRRNDDLSEKFTYKLSWMERLYERLKTLRDSNIPFAIGGDFNIIAEDKDCWDPAVWEGDAATRPESRALYRKFINLGLYEAFRSLDSSAGQYTFWDYQAGRWQKDQGIRIDHFLLSPEYADRLEACEIDKDPRGWDKPSDHTPISITLRV